jgi:hypothetical protein
MDTHGMKGVPSNANLSTSGSDIEAPANDTVQVDLPVAYRLYKRRFAGCIGMVSSHGNDMHMHVPCPDENDLGVVEHGHRHEWSLVWTHLE